MHGGLELEQGVFLEIVEGGEMGWRLRPPEFGAGCDVEDLPSETPIAEQSTHVLVPCEAPVTQLRPIKNRSFAPPAAVCLVRILDKGGVAGIEGNGRVFRAQAARLASQTHRGNAD